LADRRILADYADLGIGTTNPFRPESSHAFGLYRAF